MRIFVIGDIHGNAHALDKLLMRARFDFAVDRLIVDGDVADGGRYTRECVSILLKVRDLIFVIGNHDVWALNWLKRYETDGWADYLAPPEWVSQGGYATMESYEFGHLITKEHVDFFERGQWYYVDEKNNLFVHGGINPKKSLEEQIHDEIIWDRGLIDYALRKRDVPGYNRVYIGHTSTMLRFGVAKPVIIGNLVCVDTGVYLSLIEIDMEKGPIGLWQEQKVDEEMSGI
jgi:serine/threonine protein phosphatase 1